MLNKSTARSEYTVQSGVAQYPVGFTFYYNGNDTPQVRVRIGDIEPVFKVDYKFSEDDLMLILMPTEEESSAEGFVYDEYKWLDKWVDLPLVIERDVPLVQESEYSIGRISPERIEKDFDLSVMRDQQLRKMVQDGVGALESGKLDIDQGKVNIGKVMTVNEYGEVVPKSSTVSGGIGVVAHDSSLSGAGTDEFPLSVKDKVTITIKDWE